MLHRKPYTVTNPSDTAVSVTGTVVRPFFTEHVWLTLQEALALKGRGWAVELRNVEAENNLVDVPEVDNHDYGVAVRSLILNTANSFAAELAADAMTTRVDVSVVNDQAAVDDVVPAASATFKLVGNGFIGQRVIVNVSFDTAGDDLTLNSDTDAYLSGTKQNPPQFNADAAILFSWDALDGNWAIGDRSSSGISLTPFA